MPIDSRIPFHNLTGQRLRKNATVMRLIHPDSPSLDSIIARGSGAKYPPRIFAIGHFHRLGFEIHDSWYNILYSGSFQHSTPQAIRNAMPNTIGGWNFYLVMDDESVGPYGLVSDTQIGSIYTDFEALRHFYEVSADNGATHVFHSGDLIAGPANYNGGRRYLVAHSAMQQAELVAEKYPAVQGLTTYLVTGNHDEGHKDDLKKILPKLRPDIVVLGEYVADIVLDVRPVRYVRPIPIMPGTSFLPN